MQSSSAEAFFKISLLTRQGSPWPTARLAVDPAPPCITLYGHLGSDRQQGRSVTSASLESEALVSVFQKKPLPMASVSLSTATHPRILQHWPLTGSSEGVPTCPVNPHHTQHLPVSLSSSPAASLPCYVTLAKSFSFLDLHFPSTNTQGGAAHSFLVTIQRKDFNISVQ